ncbi:MAG: SMC family ATPase [Ktedonobacteraceae bacterium]|nr:SMC family ATPase [Ktedonobacteraceae bacterium]
MIPHRLHLQGFMCYREEVDVSFREAKTWALCGPNGAGKSALFDAILFALYGQHRAGKQDAQALIHHDTDTMVVEFDFIVGDDEYRIRRTHTRKKVSTLQAYHLRGPNPPDPGRASPQPIPETDKKKECKEWVERTIGLDATTFTFAVLLQQGKSDALLKSDPAERHQMLLQLVDLSRYQSLGERAQSQYKDQNATMLGLRNRLAGLQEVSQEQLKQTSTQLLESQKNREAMRQRQLALSTLIPLANAWKSLGTQRHEVEQTFAYNESLLNRAEEIEHAATRQAILRSVLPILQRIYTNQQIVVDKHSEIEQLQREEEQQKQRVHEYKDQHTVQDTQLTSLKDQMETLHHQLDILRPRLHELALQMFNIAHLEGKEREYQKLQERLRLLPPHLDEEQRTLQTEIQRLTTIESTLPPLRQFAQARADWYQCIHRLEESEHQRLVQEASLHQLDERLRVLSKEISEQREHIQTRQQEVVGKEAFFKVSHERYSNFRTVDGQKTCSYCGQELTAEHLERERERVTEEYKQAREELRLAQHNRDTVQQEVKRLDAEWQLGDQQREKQKNALSHITQSYQKLAQQRENAETRATIAASTLVPEYLERIQGNPAMVDLVLCLQASYPTQQDLQALNEQIQKKASIQAHLAKVQQNLATSERLHHTREDLHLEIRQLAQAYPQEIRDALKREQSEHQQKEDAIQRQLQQDKETYEKREQEIKKLEHAQRLLESQLSEAQQRLMGLSTHCTHAQSSLSEQQAMLLEEWRAVVATLSHDQLTAWEQEYASLEGAEQEKENVRIARQQQESDLQRLTHLKRECDTIPVEARRPAAELEQEAERADQDYHRHETHTQELHSELIHLQQRQSQRDSLCQEEQQATRQTFLYKELARLLDKDHLQRYLLQEIEKNIVRHANEVLDRLSGGMLLLELIPTGERSAKALNLVAYNREISATKAQPVDLLSGSQQFRVAVSLTLGIGKYAGRESHRIETVIIDEGFGSLDEQGRRDMIQVIRDLENDLQCIIVVSHQREFFDEFEDKYAVELVDGSTKITLK